MQVSKSFFVYGTAKGLPIQIHQPSSCSGNPNQNLRRQHSGYCPPDRNGPTFLLTPKKYIPNGPIIRLRRNQEPTSTKLHGSQILHLSKRWPSSRRHSLNTTIKSGILHLLRPISHSLLSTVHSPDSKLAILVMLHQSGRFERTVNTLYFSFTKARYWWRGVLAHMDVCMACTRLWRWKLIGWRR
ncbi:hypothetical protein EJ02DRAFT_510709 [Clathrospora elynae]|uniref:Uncharacterized protein n=1 Tax=Clathrospora elynae TaxID=706981 RepID=A0A6A5STD2_9PLEO|nr:hypothetical protein EJ02DRAFT_510709 [Clathrospora elynae]